VLFNPGKGVNICTKSSPVETGKKKSTTGGGGVRVLGGVNFQRKIGLEEEHENPLFGCFQLKGKNPKRRMKKENNAFE